MTRQLLIALASGAAWLLASAGGSLCDEPLRELAIDVPAQTDGGGGLAGLSPEQVRELRQVREALKAVILDPATPKGVLGEAVAALERVHTALADWGREGQLEWYLTAGGACRDPRIRARLLDGALSAARSRQHHSAFLHELWARLRPHVADEKGNLPREYRGYPQGLRLTTGLRVRRGVRETFSPDLSPLSIEFRRVDLSNERRLAPLKLQITGLEMERHLEPLREPMEDGD